jgi:hypothetical protein
MANWKAFIMGDSQTTNAIGINTENYLKKYGWQTLRKGKPSSRAEMWLGRSTLASTKEKYDDIVTKYLKEGIDFKPDLIFINLGGNDFVSKSTKNAKNAKDLAQKLLTETSATIVWLGPPPYTLPNLKPASRATIKNGNLDTSNFRFKNAASIFNGLSSLGQFGTRLIYVDPCKDWQIYMPVYATLPANTADAGKWTNDGKHVGQYGSLEYINNIVKHWGSKVFPADPHL